MDGYRSAALPLPPCSVIQGGIGSGLLYLVYTNDLQDIIHSHRTDFQQPEGYCQEDGAMVNFVDDSTVYFAHRQPDVVSQTLSNHYDKIEKYMNSNKTHLLVMAGRGAIAARRMEVEVSAGPDLIKQSVSEKLFGGDFS